MHRAVTIYTRTLHRLIQVQSCWRGFSARKRFLRQRAAALRIQSRFRGMGQRQKFLAIVGFIRRLQAMARRFLCKHRKRLEAATRRIQHFMHTVYDIMGRDSRVGRTESRSCS